MSRDPTADAAEHWNKAFETDHASFEQAALIYTLGSVLYWELHGNPCFGNRGPEFGWLGWLRRLYGSPRPKRVLELGCGNGDLVIDLRSTDFADSFHGLDLAEVGLATARRRVAEKDWDNVTFASADLNHLELQPGCADMVLAQSSIHHVENLEGLFAQVARALAPGRGLFAIHEYVGPNRWQFTTAQMLITNGLLWLMPARLKRRVGAAPPKQRIGRPTVEQMIAMDPSEAVRSAEIEGVFRRFFEVEQRVDHGGGISVLVLDEIISNFRREDPTSVRWMKLVIAVDTFACRTGLVPSSNLVLAGRPR